MTLGARTGLVVLLAAFAGSSLALWAMFADAVTLAHLSGLAMRCL